LFERVINFLLDYRKKTCILFVLVLCAIFKFLNLATLSDVCVRHPRGGLNPMAAVALGGDVPLIHTVTTSLCDLLLIPFLTL